MILEAGTFRVAEYRKAIPDYVKVQVLLNMVAALQGRVSYMMETATFESNAYGDLEEVNKELRKFPTDARELQFDHDPALVNRPYDTEAGDFIPPQNDPKHIFARRKTDHAHKTFGRKPDAAKTVTTRGSDVGEAARVRDIRARDAVHRAAMASKSGDFAGAAAILSSVKKPRRLKKKIPSRPFNSKGRRPFPATERRA